MPKTLSDDISITQISHPEGHKNNENVDQAQVHRKSEGTILINYSFTVHQIYI